MAHRARLALPNPPFCSVVRDEARSTAAEQCFTGGLVDSLSVGSNPGTIRKAGP
jgi:hypothetical protein